MFKNLLEFLAEPIIFVPLLIIGLLILLGVSSANEHKKEDQAMREWISACAAKPGYKVESIGGGLTSKQYLVCNPK